MDFKTFIYVVSIAFQVTAAIVLIIHFLGETKNRIVKKYFSGAIASSDNENNAILELKRVRLCAQEIYATRWVIVDVIIGYATAIFGDKGEADNWHILLLVGAITASLVFIELLISKVVAKINYKEDLRIKPRRLPEDALIEISEQSINDLFKA